ADDLALDTAARGIADRRGAPGIGLELLQAQRNALGLPVELQDLDPDLVADVQHLAGVVDAPPGHVGDVKQSVDAAQVHEGAVLRDVLDDARDDLALLEGPQRVALLLGVLLFEDRLAGQHDVAPLLVDLDDPHAQLLPAEAVEVAHGAQIDLAAGQEGAPADVHREAALDALDHAAGHDAALLVGALHVVPDLHLLGFFLGQDDVAFLVLGFFEQDVHGLALLDHD